MTIEAVRDLVTRLSAATSALAAVGAALDERVSGARLNPAVRAEVDRVWAALAGPQVLDGTTPEELAPILAGIRTTVLQAAKLIFSPTSGPGWTHTERDILQSIGDVSAAFARSLRQTVVPQLAGLSARLESNGAAFLDVGVGVGALAVTMARLWPTLHVVGIDVWAPSLTIARENVKMAELTSRISLREQAVEELSDADAFDLAWLPGFFINDAVIGPAVQRIHRALRPGGWILFGIQSPGPDPLTASLARLRTVLWGGQPRTSAEVEILLKDAGYADVTTLANASSAVATTVGRRS